MSKLLQVNITSNMLSTGKICEDIAKVAVKQGWETYIAYGRWGKESISTSKRVGTTLDMYKHYALHRLFDGEGLASKEATKKLICWIDEVNPDIIHLHNIHDHYLNYPILFRYLSSLDTPVVWTQHDCWAFTGGCMYADLYKCEKWRTGCAGACPNKRAIFCNKSEKQFALKKEVFAKVKNLTFISVSNWLAELLKKSYHCNRRIITIHNGINIEQFKPLRSTPPTHKPFQILGVAAIWDERKGLKDFLQLRSILSFDYEIILVGLKRNQIKALPLGIKGITRTTNALELVQLYSDVDVFVNPTHSDNFPTTNLEALACGTPVITYETGGSPEAVDANTGFVVKQGDVEAMANTIRELRRNPLSSIACRQRAEACFDKDKCFQAYIDLYNNLLQQDER